MCRLFLGLLALLWVSLPAGLLAPFASAQTTATSPYWVGRGISDITGPPVGVGFWGFGRPDQRGEGLHTRLKSRAFIVAEASMPERRLVFVSADLGSVDHHITLEVAERLQARYASLYPLSRLIISATHTHSAPGGYWHSRTETGLDGGLYPDHFEAIVAGITASIVQAHEDLRPGSVRVNRGIVENAGVNRSRVAYVENPEEERARYEYDTNKRMTQLTFTQGEKAVGVLNWYALHPTAMNFYNRLVSGDHKGYASWKMERDYNAMTGEGVVSAPFVAAFAQADPGDVTPNIHLNNTGPGATDVETTQIMGQRQLAVARRLFAEPGEALRGPVDARQVYVDMGNYEVAGRFTGHGAQHTCPSAYGYSFAAGSSEDGGAHFLFWEGMRTQYRLLDWLVRRVTGTPGWTAEVQRCQAPKPILFQTGTGSPPLQSQIRSVTLARIGQFVILALPAEVTTMSGRRLRNTVRETLGEWPSDVVLAGYSNGYAGYVTTPEEYRMQQYEAGHTLHGPWTLPAYQQVASQLATALTQSAPVLPVLAYDDWRGRSEGRALPGDESQPLPQGFGPGDPLPVDTVVYSAGETVVTRFYSVNPTTHFAQSKQSLRVEHQLSGGWQTVFDDSDWSTRIRWQFEPYAIAQVEWQTADDTPAGDYRIVHRGIDTQGRVFEGVSPVVHVQGLDAQSQ